MVAGAVAVQSVQWRVSQIGLCAGKKRDGAFTDVGIVIGTSTAGAGARRVSSVNVTVGLVVLCRRMAMCMVGDGSCCWYSRPMAMRVCWDRTRPLRVVSVLLISPSRGCSNPVGHQSWVSSGQPSWVPLSLPLASVAGSLVSPKL